jgi:hypothetical protein
MDDTMTQNAMGLLKIAPIMLLVNGYWMLSNRMIYANFWAYVEVDGATMSSGHILKMEYDVNWASPILVMVIASFFILFFQYIFSPFLQAWGFTMAAQDIVVDEDLPNFFDAVMLSQADEIVMES